MPIKETPVAAIAEAGEEVIAHRNPPAPTARGDGVHTRTTKWKTKAPTVKSFDPTLHVAD